MNTDDLLQEIRDLNLNYLMLAQHMILLDKDMAIHRLGITMEIADLLGALSLSQVMKLANVPVMLAKLRFDDTAILNMLTDEHKSQGMTNAHVSILLASQSVNTRC